MFGKLWQVPCGLREAAKGGCGVGVVQTEMLEGEECEDYRRLVPRSSDFLCKQWGAQRNL